MEEAVGAGRARRRDDHPMPRPAQAEKLVPPRYAAPRDEIASVRSAGGPHPTALPTGSGPRFHAEASRTPPTRNRGRRPPLAVAPDVRAAKRARDVDQPQPLVVELVMDLSRRGRRASTAAARRGRCRTTAPRKVEVESEAPQRSLPRRRAAQVDDQLTWPGLPHHESRSTGLPGRRTRRPAPPVAVHG